MSHCAKYVAENSHADNVRTGDAIRSKVIKYLSVNFATIENAEKHFKIQVKVTTLFATGKTASRPLHTATASLSVLRNSPVQFNTESSCAAGVLANCLEVYEKLTFRMKEQLLNNLFQKYFLDFTSDIDFAAKFESDFLCKGSKKSA